MFSQKKNSTKIELNAIKIPRKNRKKKSKVKLIEVAIEATVMYREKKKCHQKGASQCCYHHCCRQMMLSAYCHYGAIQQSDIDKIYGQFSSVMKTCCCKALQTVSSYNDWRQRKGFIGQCVWARASLAFIFPCHFTTCTQKYLCIRMLFSLQICSTSILLNSQIKLQ